MSNFKRMKLVPDNIDSPLQTHSTNILKHQIPVSLSRLNDLDSEINDILISTVDENLKAKLYSQALRRFLTFKKLHKEETEIARQKEIQTLTKVLAPQITKRKQTKKVTIAKSKIPTPKYTPRQILKKRVIKTRKSPKNVFETPAKPSSSRIESPKKEKKVRKKKSPYKYETEESDGETSPKWETYRTPEI